MRECCEIGISHRFDASRWLFEFEAAFGASAVAQMNQEAIELTEAIRRPFRTAQGSRSVNRVECDNSSGALRDQGQTKPAAKIPRPTLILYLLVLRDGRQLELPKRKNN
jgi:hypothetical protein